jgi:hypothetical protein
MLVMAVFANKMDRETIENILNSVSSSCREEMEVALTSPSEISSSCKHEMQAALARKSDDGVEFVDTEKKQKKSLEAELGFWENPKYILGTFILLGVAGAGLWIYYVEDALKRRRSTMPKGLRRSPKKTKPDGGSIFD